MLDCIKNLKRHPPRMKPKKSPWAKFIPGLYSSRYEPVNGHIFDCSTVNLKKKVIGKGEDKFPK